MFLRTLSLWVGVTLVFSCALQLAKEYHEDVILLEAGHIGWGSSARNAGFLCIPAAKMSIEKNDKTTWH